MRAVVVQSESLAVRGLVRLIATLGAHLDSALFDSPPGTGPVIAPRLLVALGSDRERFAGAGEIQSYSGIGPVTELV